MAYHDIIGYLAAAFVGLSFLSSSMISLRLLAAISNALFIQYGLAGQLDPVVVLHSGLLPVNLFYLSRLLMARRRSQARRDWTTDLAPCDQDEDRGIGSKDKQHQQPTQKAASYDVV